MIQYQERAEPVRATPEVVTVDRWLGYAPYPIRRVAVTTALLTGTVQPVSTARETITVDRWQGNWPVQALIRHPVARGGTDQPVTVPAPAVAPTGWDGGPCPTPRRPRPTTGSTDAPAFVPAPIAAPTGWDVPSPPPAWHRPIVHTGATTAPPDAPPLPLGPPPDAIRAPVRPAVARGVTVAPILVPPPPAVVPYDWFAPWRQPSPRPAAVRRGESVVPLRILPGPPGGGYDPTFILLGGIPGFVVAVPALIRDGDVYDAIYALLSASGQFSVVTTSKTAPQAAPPSDAGASCHLVQQGAASRQEPHYARELRIPRYDLEIYVRTAFEEDPYQVADRIEAAVRDILLSKANRTLGGIVLTEYSALARTAIDFAGSPDVYVRLMGQAGYVADYDLGGFRDIT